MLSPTGKRGTAAPSHLLQTTGFSARYRRPRTSSSSETHTAAREEKLREAAARSQEPRWGCPRCGGKISDREAKPPGVKKQQKKNPKVWLVEHRRVSPDSARLWRAQLAQPRRRGGNRRGGERPSQKIHPPGMFGSAGPPGCTPAPCLAGSADGCSRGTEKPHLHPKFFLESSSQRSPALPPLTSASAPQQGHS